MQNMKKLLAGFLATAMVASMGTTAIFAATSSRYSTSTVASISSSTSFPVYGMRADTLELIVDGYGYSLSMNGTAYTSASALASAVSGSVFQNVMINNKAYTVRLTKSGTSGLVASLSPTSSTGAARSFTVRVHGRRYNASGVLDSTSTYHVDWNGNISAGTSDLSANITWENLPSTLSYQDVIVCDGDGNPLPLLENGTAVDDGDSNGSDGVRSGSTLYFMIKDAGYDFDNSDAWKLRINKRTNGKYIKNISDVTKIFKNDLFNANGGGRVVGTGGQRHRYIKVELNEIYTDDEYKVTLNMRLTPKQRAVDRYNVADSASIQVKDFSFWLKNLERDADNEWRVGVKGLMLNPLENDWNEVTYYDEENDLAFVKFFADSDVGKFYAKLSTKWEHADYASYFNDQDAFIFDFTGSPKLSSTSRADLQIYNPFVDKDGNVIGDPTTAVIYQVIDGDLFDVTDSFTYEEGENGEMAYTCRTRFLGTYIICQKPVPEAN